MNLHSMRAARSTEAWLSAFPFGEELSRRGADLLRGAIGARSYPAGAVLLEAGQSCEEALLVTRGTIRVYTTSPCGREITLYLVSEKEMCLFGVSCLLSDTRYPARAVAKVDTEALGIPAPAFRRLFREEPAVQRFVLDAFSSRLLSVTRLVEEVAFLRLEERLAEFLRKEAIRDTGGTCLVPLSHEEIAAHLGTAREVVSRLLSQMESDGRVRLERRKVRFNDSNGSRPAHPAMAPAMNPVKGSPEGFP